MARHASTSTATVRVAYRPDDLVLEVDDDGTPPHVVVPGNGITGMRERATALGGTLSAAPRAGGGFRVRAWFPLGESGVIRVLLADDQALVRAGFASLLDGEDDIEVVGEASDGVEAVALAPRPRPRRRAAGHPDAATRRARGDQADRAATRRWRRCASSS